MAKVKIEISEEIYRKIKDIVEKTEEFSSVEEYVEFVLEEVLKEDEEEINEEGEEKIKDRLKDLGYL